MPFWLRYVSMMQKSDFSSQPSRPSNDGQAMLNARERHTPPFLADGGEVGALMRSLDWSASPLGPPATWPQSLRLAVGLMLSSKFPMFIAWGPELAFLYNDAYAPILGYRHPQALGRPFHETWPEIWEEIRPLVDRALAGEASFREDLPLIMLRKGFAERTYFTFSYSPVWDENGQVAGMFCACTETTQKVLAERRHVAEIDRLRELFRQAPGFVAVLTGPDYVFELVNEAYLQLIGHRDLLGKTLREALPELEGQGFFDLLDHVYASGEPFVGHSMPIKLQRKPGEPLEDRFLTFVYQPIRDAAGNVTGIFAEGFDVTEAKKAEEELRLLNETLEQRVAEVLAERKLLTDILETTNAMIVVVGMDYRILAVNRAAIDAVERIYGVHMRVGDNLLDLFSHMPEHMAQVKAVFDRALAGEEFSIIDEFGDPQRERRYYEAKFNVLRNREGRQVGTYNFVYDVTERERNHARLAQAEAQLHQAQKMEAIGQLTGGVAHDFNNLLQALSGCLTMIGRRTRESGVRPLIEAGLQAVDRGAKLVQQLMAFARRENLRPETISLPERVTAMSELLARALRADIELITDFEPGLWPVEVDPTQFELALINLAVNARDAMPGGGILQIKATNVQLAPGEAVGLTGEFVRLCVSDTGVGMPEAVIARAFEPFFTTKQLGKGSGLGLAQVYGFAQQAGGTAWIESEPGKGTSIILLLRRSANIAVAPPSALQLPLDQQRRGRILMVEDDQAVATAITAALEDIGYEVPWVSTAEEALARLANGDPFDLLFSDVVMPGRLNGMDLAEAVRRLRPDLPVLLTTGYSEEMSRAPDVHILRKPYHITDLVRLIDDVLAEPGSPAAEAAS